MKKKIILLIVISSLFFFININNAKALTCEYEMYPISYYYGKKTTPQPIEMQKPVTTHLTITYNGKANLEVKVSSSMAKLSDDNKKFYTSGSNLAIAMSDGKCPSYVKFSGTSIDMYKENDKGRNNFYKDLDKLLKKKSGASNKNGRSDYAKEVSGWIPVALSKKDGVDQNPIVQTGNRIVNTWTVIMNATTLPSSCPANSIDASTYGKQNVSDFIAYTRLDYSKRATQDSNMTKECWEARQKYINTIYDADKLMSAIEKDETVATKISNMNSGWSMIQKKIEKSSKGSLYAETQQKLETTENQRQSATSDYCYFYCEKITCASLPSGSAKTACVSSCNSSIKTSCNKAYDDCKSVQDSAAQTQCIKGKLSEAGLDPDYTEVRSQGIKEIDEQIETLKAYLEKADKPGLNINFDPNGYKIQCSDVEFLHGIWVAIEIITPIILIVFGSMDFFRSVIAGDDKKIKESRVRFVKRLAAALLLFISFSIVSAIVSISNNESAKDTSLIKCIIDGK